jgi:YVTN family beta-propeller protein
MVLIAFIFIATSCEKENSENEQNYLNGFFITNEGAYGASNGSVSFYDYDEDSVSNEVFYNANGRFIGDVVMSIEHYDNKSFIVANGSNKIEVVHTKRFQELGTVIDLEGPRYSVAANNKLFVTQWGESGSVKVVDPATFNVVNTISVGTGPEVIINHDDKLLVANGGGYMVDSTLSVIDPQTETVVETVELAHNPKDIVVDASNNVWVLCYGYIQYGDDFSIVKETPSKLFQLDGVSYEILKEIKISDNQHPQFLEISKDLQTIYYGGGFGFNGIFSLSIDDDAVPGQAFISAFAYGFKVNPETGNIIVLTAPSFEEPGNMTRYNQQGEVLGVYEVGIGPNGASMANKK